MEALIKISEREGKQVVSARDLHEALEVKSDFTDWFKRMAEYGFERDHDFTFFSGKSIGGRPAHDYALTIDCAKEISMLQRTEVGRQIRQYFIAMENKARDLSQHSLPQTFAQALRLAAESVEKIEQQQKQIEEQKPLVVFAQALQISNHDILIGELAKILKQNNVKIGQNRLFDWLRDNGYLMRGGEQRNLPTQKAMELGLFDIKTTTINNPDGSVRVTRTTKVTPKGQSYFVNKFLNAKACVPA